LIDKLKQIDKSWTLFLDRDGVLNHQKEDSYIFSWQEFVFYEGVLEALEFFARQFGYILLVTNQRGIGKGLMTEKDLQHIHHNMQKDIELAGGRLDGIYYCADLEGPCRKPLPGMALQAQKDFPGIDFKRSVMVGNSMSDMEFGRNIGATTVFVTTTNSSIDRADSRVDAVYKSLEDFAAALQSLR
jgi:D-glycero-D-manno-heptose 1,7-bisphosphate phosphatase